MSEPEPPSAGPASAAQLGCAAAVLAVVVVRLPVQRIVFLGDPLGVDALQTPAGRPLAWTAMTGILLAVVQLIAVRRPTPGTFRRRAAVAVAFAGVWLGIGFTALGVYAGFVHDLDPRMQPTVGPGALLVVAAGLTYAGLAGRTAVRLLGRSPAAPAWQGRGRRVAVLLLPGVVALLALAAATVARRSGRDIEDELAPTAAEVLAADELDRLRGDWVIVRTEPPGAGARGGRMRFDGKTMTLFAQRTVQSQVWIDPVRRPKEIDIRIPSEEGVGWMLGVYELDGDRLTLCAVVNPPGAVPFERPRSPGEPGRGSVWYFERAPRQPSEPAP